MLQRAYDSLSRSYLIGNRRSDDPGGPAGIDPGRVLMTALRFGKKSSLQIEPVGCIQIAPVGSINLSGVTRGQRTATIRSDAGRPRRCPLLSLRHRGREFRRSRAGLGPLRLARIDALPRLLRPRR